MAPGQYNETNSSGTKVFSFSRLILLERLTQDSPNESDQGMVFSRETW